jgi:hypothetical protein
MRDMPIFRPRPSYMPDFCSECEADRHSDCHRGIGCTRLVEKRPLDYVCKCDLRAKRAYLYALDTTTQSVPR